MKNKKIMIERYRLGELPRNWNKNMERDSLDDQVNEILESDREILEMYKPTLMAQEIEKRSKSGRTKQTGHILAFKGRFKGRSFLSLGMAAAAVLTLVLILPGLVTEKESFGPDEITRIKGNSDSILNVYKKQGDLSELISDKSSLREGDVIQLSFKVSPDFSYAVIVSLDGRGVVTRHLTPERGISEKQIPGSEHLLPFAYELDDAPLYETFYLIQSNKPFPVDPLIDLLAKEAGRLVPVLNIPEIVQRSMPDADKWGELTQYAVSVNKEE